LCSKLLSNITIVLPVPIPEVPTPSVTIPEEVPTPSVTIPEEVPTPSVTIPEEVPTPSVTIPEEVPTTDLTIPSTYDLNTDFLYTRTDFAVTVSKKSFLETHEKDFFETRIDSAIKVVEKDIVAAHYYSDTNVIKNDIIASQIPIDSIPIVEKDNSLDIFHSRISDLEDKNNVAKTIDFGVTDYGILSSRIKALEEKNFIIIQRVGNSLKEVSHNVRNLSINVKTSNDVVAKKLVDLDNTKTCDLQFEIVAKQVDKIITKLGL
jgi:hypothetical protein